MVTGLISAGEGIEVVDTTRPRPIDIMIVNCPIDIMVVEIFGNLLITKRKGNAYNIGMPIFTLNN